MSAFDHKSHQEWISKVKKELKLDDLSGKAIPLNEEIGFDPFFERIPQDISGKLKSKEWKIVDQFDARSEDSSDMLESLNAGVNAIEIRYAEAIENPEDYFSGIHLHFIDLHLEYTDNSDNRDKMLRFLESVDSLNKLNVKISDNETKSHLWSSSVYKSTASSENLISELSGIYNTIVDDIDKAENKDHAINIASKISITRNVSSLIIEEIAIKNAMNSLWSQISLGFEVKLPQPVYQANCIPSKELELESRYIEQSVKGLSAAIAGYDLVYIAPADEEKKSFHKRISTNIHHLLNMESFVQKGDSAFFGSYQIETMSQQIAEEVWKNIGRD